MVSNPFSDGLSVTIRGDSSSLERATDSAQRSLSGVSRAAGSTGSALTALADRVDEAAQQFRQLDRQASSTNRSFSTLQVTTNLLTLRFGSLGAVTTATLVPALGALATTLAPLAVTMGTVVAGATALAGAFGAVIGTGLLAFGEQRAEQNQERLNQINEQIERLEALEETEQGLTEIQQEQLETLEEQRDKLKDQTSIMGGLESAFADVKEEITPLLVDFGEQFIPLIEDAINALPELVRSTIEAIGPLDQFRNALRDFGQTAMEAIPAAVSAMFRLAEIALPVFTDVVDFLLNNGNAAFEEMLSTTRELSGSFVGFGQAFVEVLPELLNFGTMVLNTVLPALSRLTVELGDLLSYIQNTAIPRIQRFASELQSTLRPGLNTISDSLGDLTRALQGSAQQTQATIPTMEQFGNIFNDLIAPAIAFVIDRVTRVVQAFNRLDGRTQEFIVTFISFAGILTTVSGILAGLASPIGLVAGSVAALAAAWTTNFGGIRDITFDVLESLQPLFESVNEVVNETAEILISEWEQVEDEVSASIEAVNGVLGQLARLASDIWSQIQPGIDSLVSGFVDAGQEIDTVINGLNDLFQGLVDFFRTVVLPAVRFVFEELLVPIFNTAARAIGENLGPVVRELGETFSALGGYVRTAGNILRKVWAAIDEFVVPIINTSVDLTQTLVKTIINAFADALKLIMNLIQGDFGAAIQNLKDLFAGLFSGAVEAIYDVLGGLQSIAAGAWEATVNIVGGALSALNDIGDALAELAGTGIEIFVDAIVSITSGIEERLADAFDTSDIDTGTGDAGLIDAGGFSAGMPDMRPNIPGRQGPYAFRQEEIPLTVAVDVNTSVDQQGNLVTDAEIREIDRNNGSNRSP